MALWPQLGGGGGRPLCGGHHLKVPLFFDAAPYAILDFGVNLIIEVSSAIFDFRVTFIKVRNAIIYFCVSFTMVSNAVVYFWVGKVTSSLAFSHVIDFFLF